MGIKTVAVCDPANPPNGSTSTIFKVCSQDYAKTGSPDTIIENKLAHRKGDEWTNHSCNDTNTYDAILRSGAPNVIVNNLQLGRVTDPIERRRKISGNRPFSSQIAQVATGAIYTFVGYGAGSGGGGTYTFRLGGAHARAGSRLSGNG